MAEIHDNKDVYSTLEFKPWVERGELEPDERYVIETYLRRDASTLEAGTGAGRILLAMHKLGFTRLHGYDFVPQFIEECRRRDPQGELDFQVQDATRLDYADAQFDQIVYLQQIVCLIEQPEARKRTVTEAFRVLRPGGTALFSFLSHEVRSGSVAYAALLWYLWMLRKLSGARRDMQTLPWLKLGGRPNWGALLDRGPYVYWYSAAEAVELLQSAGFKIEALGTKRQCLERKFVSGPEQLDRKSMSGCLFVACTRPPSA